jgi:DNA-binding NtrC family response regulator
MDEHSCFPFPKVVFSPMNGNGIESGSDEAAGGARTNLKHMLEAYERQLIETALAATEGNQRRAAASLGLLPTTLHEKMKRLGLLRRRRRSAADGAEAEPAA